VTCGESREFAGICGNVLYITLCDFVYESPRDSIIKGARLASRCIAVYTIKENHNKKGNLFKNRHTKKQR
jgi:hypothetical protein